MMVQANGDDQFIISYWHEWLIEGAERRVVLCVKTKLELQPDREGFDRSRLDALLHEASRLMQASASPIDVIRIVPAEDV